MRETVTLENNMPVELALSFTTGKIVEGRTGQRVMYSLDFPPEHVLFVDLPVSQKITMLQVAVGERFFICRRPKNGQVPIRWDVWLSPQTEKMRAAKEMQPDPGTSELTRQLDASLRQVQERKAALRIAPAPQTAPSTLPTGTNGPVAVPTRIWGSAEKVRAWAARGEDDERRRASIAAGKGEPGPSRP
jgi:hypothetical protein